jgi:hypothetical protein
MLIGPRPMDSPAYPTPWRVHAVGIDQADILDGNGRMVGTLMDYDLAMAVVQTINDRFSSSQEES